MRILFGALLLGLSTLVVGTFPAFAAGTTPAGPKPNWGNRDTAVYVVSTLNLLRTKDGRPMTDVFSKKMGVVRYDVYSDQLNSNLYFIQLKRATGSVAATFGYTMGSVKPVVIRGGSRLNHLRRTTSQVALAYHSDPRTLIGSFTSTLPS